VIAAALVIQIGATRHHENFLSPASKAGRPTFGGGLLTERQVRIELVCASSSVGQAFVRCHCYATLSTHRLCLGKLPLSVEDFLPGVVEAHDVFPARDDGQTVRSLAVVAAELDGDRAVVAFLRREVVERVRVLLVRLEVALRVVDTDRPLSVHGHILDAEPVNGFAVVLARAVDDGGYLLVLVDHLHRHEALACVGQGDRHRPVLRSNTAAE
jgi:hypothetical protein